jgi:hypothetical protein
MNSLIITKIRFRISLWYNARLLPFRIWRERPLSEVLSLAKPSFGVRYAGLPAPYILQRVLKTTRHPILMRDRRCLRQGILATRFMAAAGYKSELHFGVDRTSLPGSLQAHCWLVHSGRIVLNPPATTMVPLFIHRTHVPSGTDGLKVT